MDSIENLMITAFELFYYSDRFRGRTLVLCLSPSVRLDTVIADLRLLEAAGLHAVSFCTSRSVAADDVSTWNERGTSFSLLPLAALRRHARSMKDVLEAELAAERLPIVLWDGPPDEIRELRKLAVDAAHALRAAKVVLIGDAAGLKVESKLRSHLSREELQTIVDSGAQTNIAPGELQNLLDLFRSCEVEIVVLDGTRGSVFEELFTHRGRGTLLTKSYPNEVRRGRLRDVTELSLVMRPHVASGAILPMTESDIAVAIDSYFVFTINSAIVAFARLLDYGEAVELGKFCTLPRFQGKGRARQLALVMIDEARKQGKRYVFALSREPRMWQFFEALNFIEVPREELPESWKETYDFSRPSRAFRLSLEGAISQEVILSKA